MPTHVAFLRAINLGAKRKFPKDAIRAATESIGAVDVETHINTGNVRLTSPMRSATKVAAALEAAYLADRGFEVTTMVVSPAQLREVVAYADELWGRYGEPRAHYVSLLKEDPSAESVEALLALEAPGEVAQVQGRVVHLLSHGDYLGSRLPTSKELDRLGVQTSRNLKVIRAVVAKWC